MAECTYEYANFPEYGLIDNMQYKDVDSSVLELVNKINTLRRQNKNTEAADLINKNKELLKPYKIDAILPNRLVEELRNTQIVATQKKQQIYFDDDVPQTIADGDVWISGKVSE